MQVFQTIEKSKRIFDTGNHPILVLCNDLNEWVCKYDPSTKSLFNEVLASKFADIWEIPTPSICLIKVKEEHISDFIPRIQPSMILKECFGSFYLKNTHYIDLTIISAFDDKSFVNKISDKYDYLKIALFDIWLSNEDRNYNNSNLLLNILPESKMEFVAFDHGAIFNTNNLHNGLYIINADDTIINTDICKKLFSANKQLFENVDMLLEKFYLYTEVCLLRLDEILLEIPKSWNIDVIEYKRLMEKQLFSKEWIHQCEQAFRKYIQLYIIILI